MQNDETKQQREPPNFGLRRQSEAATALFLGASRIRKRRRAPLVGALHNTLRQPFSIFHFPSARFHFPPPFFATRNCSSFSSRALNSRISASFSLTELSSFWFNPWIAASATPPSSTVAMVTSQLGRTSCR